MTSERATVVFNHARMTSHVSSQNVGHVRRSVIRQPQQLQSNFGRDSGFVQRPDCLQTRRLASSLAQTVQNIMKTDQHAYR